MKNMVLPFSCLVGLTAGIACADDLVLTEDTTVDVPAGETNVVDCVGGTGAYTLTKTGAGVLRIRRVSNAKAKLHLEAGTVSFFNTKPSFTAGAWFAIDADDASTLETVWSNGVEYVTKVKDANGGSHYAVNNTTATALRTNPENRRVYVAHKAQNGRNVLDFGFLLLHTFTNEAALAQAYGGALTLDTRCTQVREVVQVFADRPEMRQVVTKYGVESAKYSATPLVGDSSYAGTRERFRSGSVQFYYDNSQNDAYRHGDTWLNGTTITNASSWYKNVDMPAGFNVIDSQTTKKVGLRAFGHGYKRDSGDPYGGIMIGEFYCFTNVLETADRLDLYRYLAARWYKSSFDEITIEADAVLDVAADVRIHAATLNVKGAGYLTGEGTLVPEKTVGVTNALIVVGGKVCLPAESGRAVPSYSLGADGILENEATNFVDRVVAQQSFTKAGAGSLAVSLLDGAVDSLVVSGGCLRLDPLLTPQSAAHFDASDRATLTVVSENGTNYVTRWSDAAAGTYVANDITTTNSYRLNTKRHSPYLNDAVAATGRPLMDFGYLLMWNYTNATAKALAHGGGMNWNASSSCQEVMSVMGDRPEVSKVSGLFPECAASPGPSYLAQSADTYFCRRAKLSGGWLAWDNGANDPVRTAGTLLRDGVSTKGVKVTQTAGLHVMDWRFSVNGDLSTPVNRSISAFAHTGYDTGTWGGLYIGEYVTFPTRLSDEDRARFYEALRVKWFGQARETRAFTDVTVAATASFAFPYRNLAVTDTLSLGGRLTCPEVSAANVTATGSGEIAGAVTLTDGAVLSFMQKSDGSWTTLTLDSVVAEGTMTIAIDLANPKAACGTAVRLIAAKNLPAAFSTAKIACPKARAGASLAVREDGLYAAFGSLGMMISVH